MPKRLRVAHVIVQPVLVWDDGDDLEPGPQIQPQQIPLSKVGAWLVALPGEVDRIAIESTMHPDSSPPVAAGADA